MAGGNRCAAFLMEWLGLPTLEASNAPDKLKKGTEEGLVPNLSNPDNTTGVETQQSRGSDGVVDKLDDGAACLQQGGMVVTSPVVEEGRGVPDEGMCDGGEGRGVSDERIGDGEGREEISSDLAISCDGNGSEAGIGSRSSSQGETGSVQSGISGASGTSSKRKNSDSQSVESLKRVRTPDGRVPAIGDEMTAVVEEVGNFNMIDMIDMTDMTVSNYCKPL